MAIAAKHTIGAKSSWLGPSHVSALGITVVPTVKLLRTLRALDGLTSNVEVPVRDYETTSHSSGCRSISWFGRTGSAPRCLACTGRSSARACLAPRRPCGSPTSRDVRYWTGPSACAVAPACPQRPSSSARASTSLLRLARKWSFSPMLQRTERRRRASGGTPTGSVGASR